MPGFAKWNVVLDREPGFNRQLLEFRKAQVYRIQDVSWLVLIGEEFLVELWNFAVQDDTKIYLIQWK